MNYFQFLSYIIFTLNNIQYLWSNKQQSFRNLLNKKNNLNKNKEILLNGKIIIRKQNK